MRMGPSTQVLDCSIAQAAQAADAPVVAAPTRMQSVSEEQLRRQRSDADPLQLLRLGLPGTAAVSDGACAFRTICSATRSELRLGYQEGWPATHAAAEPRLDEAHQLAPATGGRA